MNAEAEDAKKMAAPTDSSASSRNQHNLPRDRKQGIGHNVITLRDESV